MPAGVVEKPLLERLSRVSLGGLRRNIGSQLRRGRKYLSRRFQAGAGADRTPVFIAGSNRSGSQMVVRALGNSPLGWDYPEALFSIAFTDFHLRPAKRIESLVRWSPAPIVSFSAIMESQWSRDLLERHPDSRVIWIYRRYQDAANSSVHLWGEHQKDLMRWIANGELEKLTARGTRLNPDVVETVRELFSEDLSAHDGACLYWYTRNQHYLNLDLENEPRVLLMAYEDAVLRPEECFRYVLTFLGFEYHDDIVKDIFSSSVSKEEFPKIDPRVQVLCDDLKARLDAACSRTRS